MIDLDQELGDAVTLQRELANQLLALTALVIRVGDKLEHLQGELYADGQDRLEVAA
jgi:hypothetical protein